MSGSNAEKERVAAEAGGDILGRITSCRRKELERLGASFGRSVPQERSRPVVPFLERTGAILEIKRASPSRGMIAPSLDAAETAREYVGAGTSAISVLTEGNFFFGSLDDLLEVSRAVGTKAAVLRKDFLQETDEIDVSHRFGADAVLLIARILDAEKLSEMAARAFTLGLSVLLEIREDADMEKALRVMETAGKMRAEDRLVLGINCRDLATFAIDLLAPLRLRHRLARLAGRCGTNLKIPRIVSESGVLTGEAAFFVGGLGFDGVLIGEAAARNPGKARELVGNFLRGAGEAQGGGQGFAQKIARRLEEKNAGKSGLPLVKICGLTNATDALAAASHGADLLGFVFSGRSRRNAAENGAELVREVRERLSESGGAPLLVGVVTETESREAERAFDLLSQGLLDGIQFHGCEPDASRGYPALPIEGAADIDRLTEFCRRGFPRVLLDSRRGEKIGGTGKNVPAELAARASKTAPLWLAGGINAENAARIVAELRPELVDVSSGVESGPGRKDRGRLDLLFREIAKCGGEKQRH